MGWNGKIAATRAIEANDWMRINQRILDQTDREFGRRCATKRVSAV
jgi:hypothetical protein